MKGVAGVRGESHRWYSCRGIGIGRQRGRPGSAGGPAARVARQRGWPGSAGGPAAREFASQRVLMANRQRGSSHRGGCSYAPAGNEDRDIKMFICFLILHVILM